MSPTPWKQCLSPGHQDSEHGGGFRGGSLDKTRKLILLIGKYFYCFTTQTIHLCKIAGFLIM